MSNSGHFGNLSHLVYMRRRKPCMMTLPTIIYHLSDGRYKVSIPWKEFHEPLPDNYQLSLKRLQGLLCRLKQDPAILREYDSTIKDQLKKGITEAVQEREPSAEREHYLPHHAVVRQDKTTYHKTTYCFQCFSQV